ncbi:MAG: tetratricopeptide repeat protein [Acidobacteria bacterium]|nr:tetratricopeptide repeat protein [Acidobacteriota bacterium]
MSNVRGKIFCQRCKSPNELGEDSCGQCGTRLMLLVEPSGARFESRGTGGLMEEHLLERVTAIETHISRVIDKLEKMAELMLKQSRSAFFDHELLDTLITVLGESGAISRQRLAELWRERRKKETGEGAAEAEAEKRSRFDGLIKVILGDYEGDAREEFERLVRESFGEMEKGRAAAGLRRLERAAALAPGNAPLNHFIGVQLYRGGKTAPARDYLERAFAVDKENGWLHLMLGLVCGDEGEAARARQLLKDSVILGGPNFAAHYALGRLAAAEADWKTALSEFKLARATRPGPEAHYLLGLANYHLGRYRTALRELKKAVGLDEAYAEAHYLLGLVQLRLGDRGEARGSFAAAAIARPSVQLYREAFETPESSVPPAPFFDVGGRGRRRKLITGGDERLAAVLREDALGAAAAV